LKTAPPEGSFLCRIVLNSTIFCQNATEYGRKATFFATDFMKTGWGLKLRSHPNQLRAQTGRHAECITRVPHTDVPVGHRISREHRRLVTDVVKLRKLIEAFHRNFPHSSATLAQRPLLQTNGLLGLVSVLGRFWSCQILPNFTNFTKNV